MDPLELPIQDKSWCRQRLSPQVSSAPLSALPWSWGFEIDRIDLRATPSHQYLRGGKACVFTELWEPLEHGRGQHLTSRPCKSCNVLFKGDYTPIRSGDPRAHSQGLNQTMQTVPLAPVTAALGSAQARILVAKGQGAQEY